MPDSALSQQMHAANTYSPWDRAGQVAFASSVSLCSIPAVTASCLVQMFDGQLADIEFAPMKRSRLQLGALMLTIRNRLTH